MLDLFICLLELSICLAPAAHLDSGMSFREAAEVYYQPADDNIYGYATRYGSNDLALAELYFEAQEAMSQYRRGYILIGGGYGYRRINGGVMLIDNRSAIGYAKLADRGGWQSLTEAQRRLLRMSSKNIDELRDYVEERYIGIVAVRSPNDIGREFCLYDLTHQEIMGLVISGGSAARNDWMYYGPSVNDYYHHQRLGMRTLRPRKGHFFYLQDLSPDLYDTDFYWIADLTDSVYYRLGYSMGAQARLIALIDPEYCEK